ncbi:MAG: hypothetical protein NZ807_09070 [Dehalococcoidia bacterium]|nr:hypothetical protein [Dehalococcoidia bacterium]
MAAVGRRLTAPAYGYFCFFMVCFALMTGVFGKPAPDHEAIARAFDKELELDMKNFEIELAQLVKELQPKFDSGLITAKEYDQRLDDFMKNHQEE